jgi:5-methylcytosine-specific restriction enzyme subunit McrC
MRRYPTADGRAGIALEEWDIGRACGLTLSHRDLRIAERLAARPQDTSIVVRATADGVEIQTRGSVGLVRFDQFELQIEPKFPGGTLQLFRMVQFASGIRGVEWLPRAVRIDLFGANLLDLLVELLAWSSERLIRAGLRADYVSREGDLPVVRGRLLLDQQLVERMGQFDRVVCRYDEHEQDILDNQLLAVALERGSRLATDPSVRRHARSTAGVFKEVCDPTSFDIEQRARMTYDRANRDYRDAHALAWLLLDGTGLPDELGPGRTVARSFLIDMSAVFERFLEHALRALLDTERHRVRVQKGRTIVWDATRGLQYAGVRPDLLVERRDRTDIRLPVDAKYKPYGEGGRKIQVGDLSQAFLYAYAYRNTDSPDPPSAVLVYPSKHPGPPETQRLEVQSVAQRKVDAVIQGLGVHVPTLLDELESGTPGSTVVAIRRVIETALDCRSQAIDATDISRR